MGEGSSLQKKSGNTDNTSIRMSSVPCVCWSTRDRSWDFLGRSQDDRQLPTPFSSKQRYDCVIQYEGMMWLARFTPVAARSVDTRTFAELTPLIKDLWEDMAIRQTFEHRNLFQIVSLRFKIHIQIHIQIQIRIQIRGFHFWLITWMNCNIVLF